MERKRICFCTTLAGTIESFLLDLTYYLVEHENYDVTFISHPSNLLLQYTNEHIHYIPGDIPPQSNLSKNIPPKQAAQMR